VRALLAVTPLLGVAGMTINDGGPVEPPDTIVASGPLQLVELVNTAISVMNKTSGTRLSTQSLYTFFPVHPGDSLTDPFVTYDDQAGRFVLGIVEYNSSSQKSYYDFAVSNTSDASSGFTEKQQIDVTETVNRQGSLSDFPRLGWNHDAYVVTFNEFGFVSGQFENVQVLSIEKNSVLDQNPATLVDHRLYRNSLDFTMVPAVMHGAAANAPMVFVEEGASANTLRFVSMSTVPGTTPSFTSDTTLAVAAYSEPPLAAQPGGGSIQTNDSRVLSAAWRNNTLVAAQNVGTGGVAHARWYVFDTSGAAPTLSQYGEIAPGIGVSTYFPAIDIATDGDLGVTYMESSASEYMSVYVSGRKPSDSTGTMEASVLAEGGTASYGGSRAGDFSGISPDPNPGSESFWAASEYSPGSPLWATWIENFSLGGEWGSYNQNPQHTGLAQAAAQPIASIHWSTPVDLNPQYSGSDLLIHYGSPVVTPANTVIVPVKTGTTGGFELQARAGDTGALKWTQTTDYALPPSGYSWTPSYSATLTSAGQLYYPGLGGTVYRINSPDTGVGTVTQIAFYGTYTHTADTTVFINTPITTDAAGDIYFGFQTFGSAPNGLVSGIARIDAGGVGTWVSAATVSGDSAITQVVDNAAPALSNDGKTLYVPVSTGNFGRGYLLAIDSTTLAFKSKVALVDPSTGNTASLPNDGSASPTVGPDGDVYFGVLENPFASHDDRGWLLHFSSDLSTTKTPGSFGWDDTPSIVPARLVPSYHGTSTYLVMTKYNDYAQYGSGINKLAILDPTASQPDPINSTTPVMKEVLTIAGVTPDPDFPNKPGAVREWCINAAAVDVAGDCVMVNSEDGRLYAWDLSSNTFVMSITLEPATGEAYTPTIIGPDGTVYAINKAVLHAVGSAPTSPGLDFSGGFASGTAGVLTFNGGAAVNGSRLRLTDGGTFEARSVFTTNTQNITAFTSTFSFQINPGTNTADGFTFTIQGDTSFAVGSYGGGLGYATIGNSLAVKFDLADNAGEGSDSTGVYVNGAQPTVPADSLIPSGVDLHSGDVMNATIGYDGSNLSLTIADPTTGKTFSKTYTGYNIPQLVGASAAYVGFTGGTGGNTATQDILTWTYTPGTVTPPGQPQNLAGSLTGYTGTSTAATPLGAHLTWSPVAGATGYKIERKLGSNGTYAQIGTTTSPVVAFDDTTGLSTGSTYVYRVRATNAGGDGPYSSEVTLVTPTVPLAATGGSLTATTTTTLSLAWTDNATNEDGYQVFRSTGGGAFTLLQPALAPNTTTFTDTGLTPGTAFDYHVEAFNLAGPSSFLDVMGTTRTLPPTSLAATGGATSIALAWSAPSGLVNTYNVYRGTASGAETLYQSGLTTTTYTDTAVTANATYYYTVTAVDAGGESAASNEASAAATGAVQTTTIDDSVKGTGLNQFNYVGSWTNIVNTSIPNCYMGTVSTTGVKNDYATLSFSGTQIKFYGALRSNRGIVGISIDGGPETLVDEYAAQDAGDVLLYTSPGLASGNHTFEIRNTGTKDASSSGTQADVDRVDVVSGSVAPPAQPQGLAATATGYTGSSTAATPLGAHLTWSSVTSATGYKIERKLGTNGTYAQIGTTTSPVVAFDDTSGLSPGSTYFYRVRATNTGGDGPYSSEVMLVTPTVPLAPTGGSLTAATSTTLSMAWTDNATNEDGYQVFRSTGGGGYTLLQPALAANATTFTDTGLTPGTLYVYHIKAFNLAGPSNFAEVLGTTRTLAPTGLTATGSATSIALAWSVPSGTVNTYNVYRGTTSGAETLYQTGLTTNSFTDTAVTVNTTYYYKVTAVNAGGESALSNEASAAAGTVQTTTTIDDSVKGTGLDQFNYVGSWSTVVNTTIPNCYQGTVTISGSSTDSATLSFSGTQVKFYAALRSNRGIVAISIDGGPEVMVDEYGAQDQGNVLVYTSSVLAAGTHTLKFRSTGTHDASSSGTVVDVDRVDVLS
jgi:fibronectin type 3 domain-containing protein